MTVKLTGFRELERDLAEELPKATARNVMKRAASNAMERVRDRMSELAPRDESDRDEDGQHLADTMATDAATAREARALGTSRQQGVVVLTGPAPVGKRARANAGWQEFGTVKMTPNSYARPAADMEADAVIDDVRHELKKQIEKAKARIARKAARAA